MISTLIFDLDGTLLDTTEYVYQAFEHAFKRHFEPVPREKIRAVIGKPLDECIRILTGREDLIPECRREHKAFQKTHPRLSKLYPHVRETLQKLHDRQLNLAVLTSRSRDTVLETMTQEGIVSLFPHILAIEDVTHHKPHPEGIVTILELFNVTREETLMVGDSSVDIDAGKSAGVGTVGAAYGFHGNRIAKSKPDHVIESFHELLAILS